MVGIGQLETILLLVICDIANSISVSQFMYLGFLIIWITYQIPPLTFVVLNQDSSMLVICDI